MRTPGRLGRAAAALAVLLLVSTVGWGGVARAEGEAQRHLTEASWSPGGERIALLFSLSNGSGALTGLELWFVEDGARRRVALEGSRARILGWTSEGDALVLEQGPGDLRVQPVSGGPPGSLHLPASVVCLGTDGHRVFYLSEDRRYLLSSGSDGQTRVLAPLPEGCRPPGALSSDGSLLALRRSVRRPQGYRSTWITEIWVFQDGLSTRATVVENSLVRVAWQPGRPALLVTWPARSDRWGFRVVEKRGARWVVSKSREDLPSPPQWDGDGRLYAADGRGLIEVANSLRRVRDWSPSPGRLMLWALSPGGNRVLAGLEEPGGETEVVLYPLPTGAGVPVMSARPVRSTAAR